MNNANLNTPARTRNRRLAVACIVAALVSVGFLGRSWRQGARPGPQHEARGLDDVQQGHLAQAVREWQQGVKEDPTYPGCHERLGDVARQLGRMGQAEAAYQKASRLDPKNVPLLLKLEDVAERQEDTLLADAAAHQAMLLAPNNAEAAGRYGTLEAQQRRYPTALDALRRAHALEPDNARYLVQLAVTEMDIEDMRAAEQDLAPYAQAHPQDALACYLMGVIQTQKARTPENIAQAFRYARLAQAGMANDARIYNLLGELYLKTGRPVDALHIYQAGLHVAPNDEGILHGLVQGFTQVHDAVAVQYIAKLLQTAQARHNQIDHLKHVLGFNHADIPACLELGRLEESEGNPAQAQNYYVSAVNQAPNNPLTRSALAAFMRRTGRPDMARQALRPDFIPPALPISRQ